MDINEHLKEHDSALSAEARKIGGKYDRVEDCYQAGALVLIEAHDADYDHERSALLTFRWWQVLKAMQEVVEQQSREILMPAEGDEHWNEDDQRVRGVDDYVTSDIYGNYEMPPQYAEYLLDNAPRRFVPVDEEMIGEEGYCEACGYELPPPKKRGRPQRFCDDRCRQAARRK